MHNPQVEVSWDEEKKKWLVRIQVGEEVIRRRPDAPKQSDEATLRAIAVQTTADEGYKVDPSQVVVHL